MARTFPFETPNTYTPSGANVFQFPYKYSNNMNNLMTNNLMVVGEYPENLFWGGVSYEDVPQLYYGAIKYDYEARTITIDNLFDNSFEDAEFTPRQLSYAWIADTQKPYNSSLATSQLNWGINFGEDFNNTSYLDPNKAGNFPNGNGSHTYFADDIPVSKLGIAVNVLYINTVEWNSLTDSDNSNSYIHQTSLANFIGMRDNDPNYSNYRLVGFVCVGRQTLRADGTIRRLTGNDYWYGTPMNLLMSNYINSPVGNYYQTLYRLNSASSGSDRTVLSYGTYIYKDGSYGFLVDSKTGVLLNQYNGDQTFDISDFLTAESGYRRIRYNNGDKYLLYFDGGRYWGAIHILPIYNSLDDLLKVIAGYGLFFTAALQEYTSINNDNIYVPVLDDDNIYHGEYTHGETNLTNDYFEKGKNNDSTYEPKDPEKEEGKEPTPEKTENKFSGYPTTGQSNRITPSVGTQYFALTIDDLTKFTRNLWNQPKSFYDAIQIAGRQQNSIFDYIQSLRYYPINTDFRQGSTYTSINLGTGAKFKEVDGAGGTTDFLLYKLTYTTGTVTVGIWDLNNSVYHWRNNFLDYSPYLKMSIYLPYVGTVELSPEQVASHTDISKAVIYADAIISTIDGTITYFVRNQSDTLLVQKTAKLAIDLPLSGNNSLEQATAILRAQFSTTKQVLGQASSLITNAATGNAAGLLQDVGGIIPNVGEMYLQNSLAHKQVPVEVQGMSGTVTNTLTGQYPYLTIHRTKYSNPTNYGHTTGYLTESEYRISSLTGYTVCRNVDVSGISKATSKERAQIKQIMESGFYA